jgi:hypothetical protein
MREMVVNINFCCRSEISETSAVRSVQDTQNALQLVATKTHTTSHLTDNL